MKRKLVFSVNIGIVFIVALLTFLYVRKDNKITYETQIENFMSMSEGLSQVTAKYLENEQFVCDTWAAFINSNTLSLEDSLSFVRSARPKKYSSVHIIFIDDDSFEGYSIAPSPNDENDFSVSYKHLNLFPDLNVPDDVSKINITRTYTNPQNGLQSIAFYNKIKILQDKTTRDALLLRIIPTEILNNSWTFPTDRFQDAQVSLIDMKGDYIIRGKYFKNSNFFEFYKSYNQDDFDPKFQENIKSENYGIESMIGSRSVPLLVSYVAVNSTDNWKIIVTVPKEKVTENNFNWILTILIALGLLLLLFFNILVLMSYNHQLITSTKAAEAANKAKSSFLSLMSHDIRTPMNAVLGMNEMILRESKEDDTLNYASNIKVSGKTLLSLINGILDFSKIEEGKMEIIPVDYKTSFFINNIINSVSKQLEKKKLEFIIKIDQNIPSVLNGDDLRVNQVIMNLLSNSVKYTQKGRVSFTMRTERIQGDTAELYVEVSDTGIGIKKEDMQRLFEPFERLDEQKNRNIQGTGLGMSIVTRLLHLMGTTLEVESIYGTGSSFHFLLKQKIVNPKPIGNFKDHLKDRVAENQSEITLYAPKAKILVADDNESNLKVAKNFLKLMGIVPDLVSGGFEVIEKIRQKQYHLVLLDHMMPQIDGAETLKKLREENLIGSTVMIAFTANIVAGAKEEYLREGFDGVLSKPIELEKLQSLLQKYLPKDITENKKEPSSKEASSAEATSSEATSVEDEILEFAPQGDASSKEALIQNEDVQNAGKKTFSSMREALTELGIDTEEGLRYCANDTDFYIEMLSTFVSSCKDKIQELDAYEKNNDLKNYQILVHALKSNTKGLGAESLSQTAKDLEEAAKNLDDAFVKENHKNFIAALEKTAKAIQKVL